MLRLGPARFAPRRRRLVWLSFFILLLLIGILLGVLVPRSSAPIEFGGAALVEVRVDGGGRSE